MHLKGLAVDKSGGTQLSWLDSFLGHPPGQLFFHIHAESLCTSDSLPWAQDAKKGAIMKSLEVAT